MKIFLFYHAIINTLEEMCAQPHGKEVSEIYVFRKTALGKQVIKRL